MAVKKTMIKQIMKIWWQIGILWTGRVIMQN